MISSPRSFPRYTLITAFGIVASALLAVETWRAFSALSHGSLRSYLTEGIASAVLLIGLGWATRPLIGQPLFGRPKAVYIGYAPSRLGTRRRGF